MKDLTSEITKAVRFFWKTRSSQSSRQGNKTGVRDQGRRTAATGGKQMDGFTLLIRDLLVKNGVPKESIVLNQKGTRVELPGYFRPEKQWDLFVIVENHLLAVIEFKSHIGPSFGNNYNNRVEEAVGNATDIWTAYREKAFPLETRPWLGFLMLLEDTERSVNPVAVMEPYFPVFEEFRGASYAHRYKETLTRLLRERLYDGACLIMSPNEEGGGLKGHYLQPAPELTFERFVTSMIASVTANMKSITP